MAELLDAVWNALTGSAGVFFGELNSVRAGALIVAGLLALLVGRKFAPVFTALLGFQIGLALGILIAGPLPSWLHTTLSLGIAVIAGFLGLGAHRLAGVLIGALVFGWIGFAATRLLRPGPWLSWAIVIGCLLAGVLVARWWRESTLIALSVLLGALATVIGVRAAAPSLPSAVGLSLLVVLALVGAVVQIVDYRRTRTLVIPPSAGGLPPRKPVQE